MDLNGDSALNNLARVVEVIGGDQQLRHWFLALAQRPEVERRNAIYSMSEQMRADGKLSAGESKSLLVALLVALL